jgi:hypothetical protein
VGVEWVWPQAKFTQSELTTQGQSFIVNLASPEIIIEQVLNNDHAMVKKKNSNKGIELL